MSRNSPRLSSLAGLLLALAACAPDPARIPPPVTAAPRTEAMRREDDDIAGAVRTALARNDAAAFSGVSVLAWNGAVLLTGAVAKPEQRRRAAALAGQAPGVGVVHNDLVLDESPAAPRYRPDAGMELRIARAIAARPDLSGRYAVRVVDGVATLLGGAASEAESTRVRVFVEDMDAVKWVAVH